MMGTDAKMKSDEEWFSSISRTFITTARSPRLTSNDTYNYQNLPHDLRFNEGHVVTIVTYSILIVISTIGNITVLTAMWRRRRKSRTRINTMLMHLAIADLLVTFLMMPLEIFWAITVRWIAGDAMCRICSFFRIFGLYLSSFIIICISIDRYLAVLKPMNLYQVDQRGKIMLTSAWLASVICSAPQDFDCFMLIPLCYQVYVCGGRFGRLKDGQRRRTFEVLKDWKPSPQTATSV